MICHILHWYGGSLVLPVWGVTSPGSCHVTGVVSSVRRGTWERVMFRKGREKSDGGKIKMKELRQAQISRI